MRRHDSVDRMELLRLIRIPDTMRDSVRSGTISGTVWRPYSRFSLFVLKKERFGFVALSGLMFFPQHCFDCFKCEFSTIRESVLESLVWFVKICSNIMLKLSDLCKCTRCPHESMNFESLAPCILMRNSRFSGYIKNDAKIGIRKRFQRRPTAKDILELVARRRVKGGGNPPPWV